MKTVEQMQAEGMSPEDIEKALKEQGLDDATMEKALAELDALTKSDDENIDDLLKALEDQDNLLAKSDDGDDDDEEDEEDEEEDDDMGKALDLDAELVKASELYEEMTGEVRKAMTGVDQKFDTLFKSVAATQNLLIKVARAVAEIHGQQGGIQKSLADIGAAPVAGNAGSLGLGTKTEPLKKSRSEIQGDLQKAIGEGRVEARYLSTFAIRGADALPPDVKKEIGLA